MSFTSSQKYQTVFGNKKVCWGTYTNSTGGDTGGSITTSLDQIDMVQLAASGSSIVADAPTLNGTLPLASSSFTIITTANTNGYWIAFGL